MIELGRRLQSPDLEAGAQQTLGRLLVDLGRPEEGLGYLDEAMLSAVEGRLSPYTTGKVYCSLISACEELGDLRRAAEWTDATARWSEGHPFAVFPGVCRVHRAWALQSRGQWTRAEEESVRACAELVGVSRVHAAAGFVELGEVRRRVGDLDGAEEAFREAEALCGRPQAGLALLRLAQGRVDAANTIIERALEEESWKRLARAKLLPARVQIAVACDDLASARVAATELDAIAAEFGRPALLAAAASARGRLSLAEGDANAACATLRRALELWQDLDVPYEVATARLLLGQARRGVGDEDGAVASFLAAAAIFEQLGAELDIRVDVRPAAADARALRSHRTRSAGPAARRGRAIEQGHRGDAVPERANGGSAPVEHLRQDRCHLALGGDRVRVRARPRRDVELAHAAHRPPPAAHAADRPGRRQAQSSCEWPRTAPLRRTDTGPSSLTAMTVASGSSRL